MDGREEDPNKIVHFSLGSSCPGGGITLVENPAEFLRTRGKGGAIIYLMVDDLEATIRKIVSAGGSAVDEPQPEGLRATMQHYEDTEGNFGGLYCLKTEYR
jgi:predicted enzyme related to lactoylglutathione lyase